MGIHVQHWTNLISNYQCNVCYANMGRCGYLLKKLQVSTPSPVIVTLDKIVPSSVTAPVSVTPPPTITPGSHLFLTLTNVHSNMILVSGSLWPHHLKYLLWTLGWITLMPVISTDQEIGICSCSSIRPRNTYRIIIPRLARTLHLWIYWNILWSKEFHSPFYLYVI